MRVYYVEDCQLVIFLNLIMLLFFFLTEKQNGVPHKKQRFVFYFCIKELR